MRIEILHAAEQELSEAIVCYEEIQRGLGLQLKEEVRATIRWIGEHPETPRLRPKGYRRVNLKVFRYYIPYFIHLAQRLKYLNATEGARLEGDIKSTFACLHGLIQAVELESGKLGKTVALLTSTFALFLSRLVP